MSLIKRVKDSIDKYNLVSNGDKVIVSVSGGPDSVVLLHVLWCLRSDYNLDLHVFHLDHMFRGEESEADAEYVAQFAAKLAVPKTIMKHDVPAYIEETGLSKQAAARKIRYKLCNELAEEIGADKIAIGQHADDQAETVLMNFLRGAGLEGLSGIAPIREEKFIRPLLDVWREDIEQYCQEYNLNPRLDSSNLKPIYLRNKIRLELLPHLAAEFNDSIKENLNRMAGVLRVENNFLANQAKKKYDNLVLNEEEEELILELNDLQILDLALQRRVIRRAIVEFCGTKKDYYFQHIKQIEELIAEGSTGSRLQLPRGLRVKKSYGVLKFFWQDNNLVKDESFIKKYSIPGQYQIPELGLEIELKIIEADSNWRALLKNTDKFYFDQQLIGDQIKIRNRRAGDRFQPLGMQGSKKLKDFLIDEKIPREEREQIPIFTTLTGKIFAIGDLRIDERFKITEQTERIIVLKINNGGGKDFEA